CTDANIYAANGAGVPIADRIGVEGTICSPLPAGKQFPVKILFLLDASGDALSRSVITQGVQNVFQRFTGQGAFFGAIAYDHAAASLVPKGFDQGAQLATIPALYANYQDTSVDQSRSLVNALDL